MTAPSDSLAVTLRRWLPWLVAFAAGAIAVLSLIRVYGLHAAAESLRTERDLATIAARLAESKLHERTLLAEKIIADLQTAQRAGADLASLRIHLLASPLPHLTEARGAVVWPADRLHGLIAVQGLPIIAEDFEYRLWLESAPGQPPTSVVGFRPDSTGRATAKLALSKAPARSAGYFLTVESTGEPSTPAGPVMLGAR